LGEELRLTLGWVAEAVGGQVLSGDPSCAIGEIASDTRTLGAGDFFIALKGPKFDAHNFVSEAFQKGAGGALVERGRVGSVRALLGSVVEVYDTTAALQNLAHAVRKASGTRVVAITGSAGKTTTKEAIAEFLKGRNRVVRNEGNLNNHIGLPLSLLQLRARPDVAVMELGMNHAGEISALVAIAEPEARVWTNVGDAHMGFFASPDGIADAKAEILEKSNSDSLLVCNADDPMVMARVDRFAGRTLTFGTSTLATVRAYGIERLGIGGTSARMVTSTGERQIHTPLIGYGNLSNVLAAATVALDFGTPIDDVVEVAARLKPADRRGAVRHLRGGTVLIDDSYNSSPAALAAALDVVATEVEFPQKVAVIGEMLELGEHAGALHRRSGVLAAAAGLQLLFVIGGELARTLAASAVEAGMPEAAVRCIDDSESAAPDIATAIRPGDLVLVKGSRGVRTDVVADRIATEFA